jgi:hypothetical protein
LFLEYSISSMRTIQLEHYEEKAGLSGCRALWLAVIYRVLCDACCQCFDQYQLNKHASLGSRYISREEIFLATQARQFLLADRTRFQTVCNLAGLDPSHVRTRARKVTSDVDIRLKTVRPPPLHHERMRSMA